MLAMYFAYMGIGQFAFGYIIPDWLYLDNNDKSRFNQLPGVQSRTR